MKREHIVSLIKARRSSVHASPGRPIRSLRSCYRRRGGGATRPNAQFGVVTPVRPVRATSSSSTGSRMLAGYRRTASDRGRGQARPFGLSDLAAGLATCHPGDTL